MSVSVYDQSSGRNSKNDEKAQAFYGGIPQKKNAWIKEKQYVNRRAAYLCGAPVCKENFSCLCPAAVV